MAGDQKGLMFSTIKTTKKFFGIKFELKRAKKT